MIVVKDVKKKIGSQVIYESLSIEIPTQSFFAILGRSGCGKSLLLKHILGLLQPDEGKIWVDGLCVNDSSEAQKNEMRRSWAMVFQEGALFDSLSVWENVIFSLNYHSSLSKERLREIALEKLSWVGLKEKADVYPSELSGGMRKRVAIARAVATDPKIILYDEPTTGLDPITSNRINDLMAHLHKKTKATSLIVTHDIQSVYRVCDRVGLFHDGRIVFSGTVEEMKNTSHPRVVQFLGGVVEDEDDDV